MGSSFTLEATPFTQRSASGIVGNTKRVKLNFTEQANALQASAVQTYPNPGEDYLNLSSLESCEKGHLEVFNSYGKKVLEKDWKGQLNEVLDLSKETRGIYLIKIIQDGKEIYKRVLLK